MSQKLYVSSHEQIFKTDQIIYIIFLFFPFQGSIF